ncbi:MAG: energy transducer TonB [Gammaproteobacteria bacterium]|nr:MAG: energy transducer TonB [Gammaproteobacteria bacterium]UTW42599.1 TonB family protein [bacterium SCSIO 12844]
MKKAVLISLIIHLVLISFIVIGHYLTKKTSYQIAKKNNQLIMASLIKSDSHKQIEKKSTPSTKPTHLAQFNINQLMPIPSTIKLNQQIAQMHQNQPINKKTKKIEVIKKQSKQPKQPQKPKPKAKLADQIKHAKSTHKQLKQEKISGEKYDAFVNYLYQRINQYKKYPRPAYKMGIEGDVGVFFTLLPNGKIEHLKIIQPSDSEVLNLAAIDTIHTAEPFIKADNYLKVAQNFQLVIHYRL